MSLIIATGSNIGASVETLKAACRELSRHFEFIAASKIYYSKAVEYENQPDFYNQVLEFSIPEMNPDEVMNLLLEIEKKFGRHRDIPKGPRTLDVDMIFWGTTSWNSDMAIIPHPRWTERSFVVKPLQELPFFQTIQKCFTIPQAFTIDAAPVSES